MGMVDKTRQAQPRCRLRKRYHIDLSDLHAQCEANYHRLMRLFPAYEQESRCIFEACLLYTSPSPRDVEESRMPSSA